MAAPNRHLRTRTGLVSAFAMATTVGCGMGLPLEERIASTRPLALRTEIIDPMLGPADPTRAEGLPLETARLIPFYVDDTAPLTPDAIASGVDPVWLYCALQPNEGLFACLSGRLPLEPGDIQACPAVDPTALDPANLDPSSIPVPPSPCFITGGTPAQPELTIPLDPGFLLGGDIEVTMVGHEPDGTVDTNLCLERLLSQSNDIPETCLYATQRVAVGPDGELLALAENLGIVIPGLAPIPDPIPDPDTHPRIQYMSATVFDPDDNELGVFMVERGDTIQSRVGDRIELETLAPETDLQSYLIPVDMSSYEEQVESYDAKWFRTWGDLLSPVSDDPLSINTWTMTKGAQDEEDLPPGGIATMYYTLRDGRNGVDWWWFNVEVTE